MFLIEDLLFERYVNFDFYKTIAPLLALDTSFERYVNFDFYKTKDLGENRDR